MAEQPDWHSTADRCADASKIRLTCNPKDTANLDMPCLTHHPNVPVLDGGFHSGNLSTLGANVF